MDERAPTNQQTNKQPNTSALNTALSMYVYVCMRDSESISHFCFDGKRNDQLSPWSRYSPASSVKSVTEQKI